MCDAVGTVAACARVCVCLRVCACVCGMCERECALRSTQKGCAIDHRHRAHPREVALGSLPLMEVLVEPPLLPKMMQSAHLGAQLIVVASAAHRCSVRVRCMGVPWTGHVVAARRCLVRTGRRHAL